MNEKYLISITMTKEDAKQNIKYFSNIILMFLLSCGLSYIFILGVAKIA
jgi:hypothetical protein